MSEPAELWRTGINENLSAVQKEKEKTNLTMHQLATLPSDRLKKKLQFDGCRNAGPCYP